MWKQYWNLVQDPFDEGGSPFVPLAAHQEAVARIAASIQAGRRLTTLQDRGGMGKSRVLAEALRETRHPWRRLARCSNPVDGASLFAELAIALGAKVAVGASRSVAWRQLIEAVRLCQLQRFQVVLAVDDCQDLLEPVDRLDLNRLTHANPSPGARLSVIQVFRLNDLGEDKTARMTDPWEESISLPPLMRSECEHYLTVKLAAAGRTEPTFTPRAIHRLHVLSEGVPRSLDRLATLALVAGAIHGVEMVPPEVIERISTEYGQSSLCA